MKRQDVEPKEFLDDLLDMTVEDQDTVLTKVRALD